MSKRAFLDDIAMSLGGYVAEKEVFGDITTGPSNDLQVATGMARDMVTKYGMSSLGPIALEGEGGALYGRGIYGKEYSESMGTKIDEEVKMIMDKAWERAQEIVTSKRVVLDAIAEELIRVENLERNEFDALLIAHGIVPKSNIDIL
jgi:cell division protease FtsH